MFGRDLENLLFKVETPSQLCMDALWMPVLTDAIEILETLSYSTKLLNGSLQSCSLSNSNKKKNNRGHVERKSVMDFNSFANREEKRSTHVANSNRWTK